MSTRQIGTPSSRGRLPEAGSGKSVVAAGLGAILEYYEFVIFLFLIPTMAQHFFPEDAENWIGQMSLLAIFAAGYIARPLGGGVLGALGDVFGRKRTFTWTIILMSGPTLAMGLLPTYGEVGWLAPLLLLVCRLLQGVAAGGEIPTAVVFIAETVSPRKLAFSLAAVGACISLGQLLGSLANVGVGIATDYGYGDWAWRVPFVIGGVFGFLSYLLRSKMRETPVFQELQARKETAKSIPIRMVIRDYQREILVGLALAASFGVILHTSLVQPALYLRAETSFEPRTVELAQFFAIFAAGVVTLILGWCADRFGWTKIITMAALIQAFALLGFFYTTSSSSGLIERYVFLGMFASTAYLVYPALVRMFPAHCRLTGFSLCYNGAHAVLGSTTPLALTALGHISGVLVGLYGAAFCIVIIISAPLASRLSKMVQSNGTVKGHCQSKRT